MHVMAVESTFPHPRLLATGSLSAPPAQLGLLEDCLGEAEGSAKVAIWFQDQCLYFLKCLLRLPPHIHLE